MADMNAIDMNLEGGAVNVSETTETSGFPVVPILLTTIGGLTFLAIKGIKNKPKREEKKAARKQKKLDKMARKLEKAGYYVCLCEDCVDAEPDVEEDDE